MRPEDQVKDAAPPPPPPGGPTSTDVVREQDKLMLILSYLWLAALVPLLTVNDSEFVRWHAKNGLVLSLGGFTAAWILGHIPFIGWFAWILDLVTLVLMVASIYRALEGRRMRIPAVSDVADKL